MPKLVNVVGFEPSIEQRDILRKFLKQMKRMSPSQATIEFEVEMTDSVYNARITVRSFHGVFEANACNMDLSSALESLKENIGTKLMDWKVTRFNASEEKAAAST